MSPWQVFATFENYSVDEGKGLSGAEVDELADWLGI
jgi:hypothetical protein